MLLTCVETLIPGKNYLEKAETLKSCGYDGMTVYADYDEWTKDSLAMLKEVKAATGLAIPEFAFVGRKYGHLMDDDPVKSGETLEMYLDAVRVCGELGALTELEFDVKRKTGLSFEYNDYPYPEPEMERKFLGFMDTLCAEGERCGVSVLLEACNRYEELYINRQDDAARLVSKLNRSNTGILSDLFHMSLDEENLPAVLRRNQRWIRHIHLGDTNRRLPGRGEMNWSRIADACREMGYCGWFNLECSVFGDPVEELTAAASYLRVIFDGDTAAESV